MNENITLEKKIEIMISNHNQRSLIYFHPSKLLYIHTDNDLSGYRYIIIDM